MTSHEGKCDLTSILSMSCHQRAQAFADRLRSRLTSLDSEELNGTPHETSWLSTHKDSVALSQPKHNSEFLTTNFYLNLVSPGSLIDETDSTSSPNTDTFVSITNPYQNRDDLLPVVTSQYDSDSSDGPFYDCQGDLNTRTNGNYEEIEEEDLGSSSITNEKAQTQTCITNGIDHIVTNGEEKHEDCETYNGTESNNFDKQNHIRSDDENEAEEEIPRVRRCSSLKTGKTPPGTPSQKKIVRFADVFGLDLADVRTFLDEIPKIPNSAFNDLVDVDIKPESDLVLSCPQNRLTEKILVPLFQQPGSLPNFIDRLRDNQVCLDCALVEDPTTCLIRGFVRVKNLDFHKTVHIRYSIDSWQTFTDVQAVYVENSCDGFSDKFSFMLYANNVQIGEKIEFAVRFQCKGCQYWDNNNGINYIFQCLPGTSNNAALTALDELSTFY